MKNYFLTRGRTNFNRGRLLLSLWMLPCLAVAQNGDDAGLWSVYHSAESDSLRLVTLAKIGFEMARSKPDSAQLLAESALAQSREIGERNGEAAANLTLGGVYGIRGEFDKAITYFLTAEDIYKALGDQAGLSRVYNERALLLFSAGELREAVEVFNLALDIERKSQDEKRQASLLHNLGRIHQRLGNYAKAIASYTEARQLKEKLLQRDPPEISAREMGSTYVNLGTLFQELNQIALATENYEAALHIYEEAYPRMVLLYNLGTLAELTDHFQAADSLLRFSLQMAQENEFLPNQPYLYDALGNVARKQGNYAEAHQWYARALSLLDTVPDDLARGAVLNNQALAFFEQERYGEAKRAAQQALSLASASGRESVDAFKILASVNSRQGNFREATRFWESYAELKDTLDSQERRQELEGYQALKDMESREALAEIEAVRQEAERNALLKAEAEKWIQGLMVAFAFALLLAILLFFSQRKLRKAYHLLSRQKTDLESNFLELQTTHQQLGLANQKLQQFAFAAGHDLKESLRGITSFTQLAAREIPPESSALAHLHTASEGGKRMRKMLDSLINYGYLGANQMEPVNLRLEEVIGSVQTLLAEEINAAQAQLTIDCRAVVKADRIAMEQLFINLLDNAIRYRKEDEAPRIAVYCERRDGQTRFFVSDNGRGIDPGYAEKMFEPFQRLHNRSLSGSGLGLSICRRIVELYGGAIWHEASPEGGATFVFTLPKAVVEPATVS